MLKKLDEIIGYFKNEFDLLNDEYKKSIEERRFTFNTFILIFSALVVLFSAIIQTIIKPELIVFAPSILDYLSVIIGILFLTILYSIFHHVYFDWKDYKHYFNKKISLEIILKFLLHLKLTEINEKDLEDLVKRIKFDFRDYRKRYITNRKEYLDFEKRRYNEYLHVIDKINAKIIKKDESANKN